MTHTESLIATITAGLLSSSVLLAVASVFLIGRHSFSISSVLQAIVLLVYVGLIYVLTTMHKRDAVSRQKLWRFSLGTHVVLLGAWFIALGKLAAVVIAPEAICMLLHWPALAIVRKEVHHA